MDEQAQNQYQHKGTPPFLTEGMEIKLRLRLGEYDAVISETSPSRSYYRIGSGKPHPLQSFENIIAWNPVKAKVIVHL